MFIEPEPTESKVAAKADPSAPSRSAIRRQRTVRYSPHTRDRQSLRAPSAEVRQHRRLRDIIRDRDANDTAEWALSRARQRTAERERQADRDLFRAEQEHHRVVQRQRMQHGRALLRDALSYERPGERMRLLSQYDNDTDMDHPIPMSDSTRASYSEILQRRQGAVSNLDIDSAQIRARGQLMKLHNATPQRQHQCQLHRIHSRDLQRALTPKESVRSSVSKTI